MANRTSLVELQEQCAFTLDVNVEKGERIIGGFGKTFYQARWINGEESPVVLIEMKGEKLSEQVFIYISLQHSHIIKTYGLVAPNNHIIDPNAVLLLQEYAEAGDLGSMLSNQYFIPQQNVLLEIFLQVADAMIFLSKNGITHGDLACRNVLVFKSHPHDPKQNLVKLTDFGLTQNNSKSSDVKIDIPMRYAAREILRSKGLSGYSEKSDVYSFAVFMWEACSFGRMPYEDINDDEEVCRQKLEGKRLPRPVKCDPNIWKLMNLCWNDRLENRPTFQMIHKQLKNIQNIEFPSSRSKSLSSSSPPVKDNLYLFEIEYEICQNCQLRYTDYDSHLHSCSEQELTCYACGNTYRRASFDDHTKNCDDLSNAPVRVLSPVRTSHSKEPDLNPNLAQHYRTQIPLSSSSNNRLSSRSSFNTDDSYSSRRNSSTSLVNSSYQFDKTTLVLQKRSSPVTETSIHLKPVKTRKTSVREQPSQLNTGQLPCEFCEKSYEASQLSRHQAQCDKKNQERLEVKRRAIEQQKTTESVHCSFCSTECLIEELDKHQNTCLFNPTNVPDEQPILSSTRSISVPDLRNPTSHSEISKLSNDSIEISKNLQASPSTNDIGRLKSAVKSPIPLTKKNIEEPSRLRKLLSRLWPLKKKRAGK